MKDLCKFGELKLISQNGHFWGGGPSPINSSAGKYSYVIVYLCTVHKSLLNIGHVYHARPRLRKYQAIMYG